MGTRINHAILHVFDFNSCVNVFSQEELDLGNKQAKAFVGKHVRKCLNNLDNMHGQFVEESNFAFELNEYFCGNRDFVDLSIQIAEFFAQELNREEKAQSADLLVVDWEEDAKVDLPEDATEEQMAAAYDAHAQRYFGMLLLESKPAFMHEVGHGEGGAVRNEISRHYAILPNPSQKVQSYAVVDMRSMDVMFVDKERTIAGQETMLIPDGLLQCTKEASSKEVLGTVTRIVEEVAEEFGANTAVALSKAKSYVAECIEAEDDFSPEELAEEVFADGPMRQRFVDAAVEEQLPERVPVERKVVERVAKNHKIRTVTGIEVTFPAEYCQNSEFIEFVSSPNGLISIELKNIGHIENR